MPRTTVHMIGQAHLDPVWLWRWTEGRAEALATSQSAVDRLREYPEFHFVRGESQVYEWIEQEDPALFAAIVEYIRQGRWHVVNGMVVQPDMNLPSGESFVRQVLLGKRYMIEKLGVEPRVAYCVDSFGHAGTLPQIFKKCGFDAYVFMRPGPHEKELPAQAFWWEAPDGSRVLAFRITASYGTGPHDHTDHILAAVAAKPPQLTHTMCFFGVGNHGGGPTKQQIENVQQIARARQDELEIRFSHPQAYFDAIRDEAASLPVVADELQYHAVGCYSVVSALKRAHRQAEGHLLVAERLAALAEAWGAQAAPRARLRPLWRDVCFNEFHDTLGGSSIKEAEDEAIMAFSRVILGAREIANDAGRAIAARVHTVGPAGGGAFLLFNPAAHAVTQYVEYEPWIGWGSWEDGRWGLTDDQGQPVPHQTIDQAAAAGRRLGRVLFPATLPPLGYRVYHFAPDAPRAPETGSARAEAIAAPPHLTIGRPAAFALENDRLAVRVAAATGAIISCIDKASGIELVGSQGWNVTQVLADTSDTWSHAVTHFDQVIGVFSEAQITIIDNGPLQASLLIERRYGASVWTQQLILRHGASELIVHNWLNWQGQWKMLKLACDVATAQPTAVHDIPFGWRQRPTHGAEVPTQMWMDVSGPSAAGPTIGLALLNDGKYSCDVSGSTLRLTILRCPPYAYHIPHVIGSKGRYDWVDQGMQEFTVILRPHVGDWREAGIVARARELNQPLVTITAHSHAGARPASDSLMELTSQEMELTALKPAEDGQGYIVRVADRYGRGGSGELRWMGQPFALTLAPFEVATLRLTRAGDQWQAVPCDMIERPL